MRFYDRKQPLEDTLLEKGVLNVRDYGLVELLIALNFSILEQYRYVLGANINVILKFV